MSETTDDELTDNMEDMVDLESDKEVPVPTAEAPAVSEKQRLEQQIVRLKQCVKSATDENIENNEKGKRRLDKANKRFVEATTQLRELERQEEEANQQRREAERNVSAAERRLHLNQIEWTDMEKARKEIEARCNEAEKDEGKINIKVIENEEAAFRWEEWAIDVEKQNEKAEKCIWILGNNKEKAVKELQKLKIKRKKTAKALRKQQQMSEERLERVENKKKKGMEKLQKRKALPEQKDMGQRKGSQKHVNRLHGATKNEKKGKPTKEQKRK